MTIYFYKVDAPYGCFSNFSPHPIHCRGLDWLTVEHYYQAHKFVGSEHQDLVGIIREAATPELAAALGRNPQYQVRSDWEEVKRKVMWEGVFSKFSTHLEIQSVLLATDNELIVEDSPTDYYWGCGLNATGRNELGKILMAVRDLIRRGLAK